MSLDFFSSLGLEKQFLEAWSPSCFPALEPLFLSVVTSLTRSVQAVQFIAISGRCLTVTLGFLLDTVVQVGYRSGFQCRGCSCDILVSSECFALSGCCAVPSDSFTSCTPWRLDGLL